MLDCHKGWPDCHKGWPREERLAAKKRKNASKFRAISHGKGMLPISDTRQSFLTTPSWLAATCDALSKRHNAVKPLSCWELGASALYVLLGLICGKAMSQSRQTYLTNHNFNPDQLMHELEDFLRQERDRGAE